MTLNASVAADRVALAHGVGEVVPVVRTKIRVAKESVCRDFV
jgi:hypothetical protein